MTPAAPSVLGTLGMIALSRVRIRRTLFELSVVGSITAPATGNSRSAATNASGAMLVAPLAGYAPVIEGRSASVCAATTGGADAVSDAVAGAAVTAGLVVACGFACAFTCAGFVP